MLVPVEIYREIWKGKDIVLESLNSSMSLQIKGVQSKIIIISS